ncbi:MAG: amidohydrolase [Candidatus Handelsmanbacteria bacterium RIFCSPLOWO2_12_FULL_64_10]|uniref:Amidohydrolase n=1 Tax=Handelsmanbacteria sp. (strain RIFCSPLOWO2_12_FULL_64_10) TaxID=1817868 RepID=A0A1F6CSM9_HANXR|nr:MAG: amidohydrolase [Candidatus Handelsmanbacteria bacterium RIFCSPLOWO2_12_FULL_64_10]
MAVNYIDAHVHVWTDDFERYPLAEGFRPEQMRPATFLPQDILRHAGPSGVGRVVLIQMSYYGSDNRYMLGVIRDAPEVFRGVAIVDWRSARPDLEMRRLGRCGVRGFRVYPAGVPSATWLDGEGYERMFRAGAEEGLAVCPLIDPDGLPALSRMCERFPETPVLIDHLARIGARGPARDADVDALCRMARHRNAMVKVSAFYALGEKRPPYLDLAPIIRRVRDAFGAERLMWASDCPYQVQGATYEEGIALIRDRLDFLSSEEREWILRKTAERFFFE